MTDEAIASVVAPGEFKLYRSPEGVWMGVACVDTPQGPIYVTAKTDERVLRAAIASKLAQALEHGAAAGGLFDFVKKAASSVAKVVSAPVRGAISTVSKVAKGDVLGALRSGVSTALSATPLGMVPGAVKAQESAIKAAAPVVAKLAPIASVVPGIGPVAAPLIGAGARLLSRAYEGDKAAQASVAAVRRAAPSSPHAAKAARVLDHLARLRAKAKDMRAEIARLKRQRGGPPPRMPYGAPRRPYGAPPPYAYAPPPPYAYAPPPPYAYAPPPRYAYGPPMAYAGASENGTWITAQDGSQVFVPAAYAGGPLWDTMRPRLGYRAELDTPITTRRAYRNGIDVLATLR